MKSSLRIWALFTRAQRRSAVILLALLLVGMVLEMLGIGLVIPALAFMTGEGATRYPVIEDALARLGNPSPERLALIGLLGLVAVFAVKTVAVLLMIWYQMRFLYAFQADLSQRLFEGYLRQPYAFHLQRNSAQLIANAVTEVTTLLNNALLPVFQLLSELFVLVGVTALLIMVEPFGAFFLVGLFALASFGFHRLTRARILRWGEERQLHDGLRIQHLQQGLGGVKEVKLLGREQNFAAKFRISNEASARAGQRQSTVSSSPRLWLELVLLIGLALLVLVWMQMGRSFISLVPTLGLFMAAAFRLMPSVNRALIAFQGLRYSLPVVDTLYAEMTRLEDVPPAVAPRRMAFEHVVALNRMTFTYQSSLAPAVCDVTLSIPKGTSVGLIGGSGAGKSTIVDVVLGLLKPVSGTVTVDGVDIQTNLRGWQDQVGYVPQTIFLTDDTLRRNIAFGLADEEIDEAAVRQAVDAAQLDQFVEALPQGLDTLVGERGVRLSGGQRQRIGIARALYRDPPFLVLDEATSALDSTTELGVIEALRALQGRKTVLVVAHRVSTVAHCNRLLRIEGGRIVDEGEPEALLGRLPALVAGDDEVRQPIESGEL